MSFYIYYGKLENELLVTILPNGTIEAGDPIHLFTQKRYLKLAAKDVSTSKDGEDTISFKDGYQSYKAVPKKGYQELDLTVKDIKGKSSQVTLTRHYDQTITAISPSDPPKIWTGAIDFHKWAKNESFIAVAPEGLGNNKPIVTLWQWTEDDKGVARALSYSTDKQVSAKGTPGVFSFKQNGYYTLNCKVDEKTNGLDVTIKGPTNAEVVQKALVLSAKVELSGEHRFAPPRSVQKKMELDCSYPSAKASLPRITGPLPFPADLVQNLSYSAAFVDQAGHLAQYAIKQFNDLEKSYRVLDNKAEARGAQVADLKAKYAKLDAEKTVVTTENTKLKKELTDARTAAAEAQKALQKKLNDALEKLAVSETKNKRLVAKNEKMRKYIAADKLADLEREKEFEAHDKADHKHIESLKEELALSQLVVLDLQTQLGEKVFMVTSLEARVKVLSQQLSAAEVRACEYKAQLDTERESKAKIEEQLKQATEQYELTKKELKDKDAQLNTKDNELKESNDELTQKQADLERAEDKAKDAELSRQSSETTNNSLNGIIRKRDEEIIDLKKRLNNLEAKKNSGSGNVQPVTAPKNPVQATVTEIVA